jgi:hypothetical protein
MNKDYVLEISEMFRQYEEKEILFCNIINGLNQFIKNKIKQKNKQIKELKKELNQYKELVNNG